MQPQHAPRLEVAGNQTTMNLPPALYQNIQTCKYFKDLYEYKTYHEVLDEIKRTVSYMEPYVPNVSVRNTPSSCFCLLFKLFLMRLTVKQMKGMLSSKDNPYLKAMGLLYLRLTLPGSELWKWFEGMMEDQDEFQAKRQGPPMTIGKLARILLTEQKWFDIVLPRLQVGPARQLEEHLREYDRQKRSSTASSSPGRRRRSPPRYGSRSRSRSRSPSRSPQRRRRSRSPQYRRRSPERRRRSRSPPHDRHRRSRSRSPPYDRHRRSPPRRKSPSPERKRRSPSPPSEAVAAAVASFTAPPKPIQSAAEMQKLRARYGDASGALEGPASLGKFNTLKPDTIILGSSQKK